MTATSDSNQNLSKCLSWEAIESGGKYETDRKSGKTTHCKYEAQALERAGKYVDGGKQGKKCHP